MNPLKRLFRHVVSTDSDEDFLKLIKGVEVIVSKALSIAMIVVILVGVIDLIIFLAQQLQSEPQGFFNVTLIEIFGLFLNILIALEVLENITAYLRKHVVQLELVIATSLTAVARKIIIFDFTKLTGLELLALAGAIFALSISYWLVRRTTSRYDK